MIVFFISKVDKMDNNKVNIGNPHLVNIDEDHFHHLGFDTSSTDISEEYSDIKVSFKLFPSFFFAMQLLFM